MFAIVILLFFALFRGVCITLMSGHTALGSQILHRVKPAAATAQITLSPAPVLRAVLESSAKRLMPRANGVCEISHAL